MLFDFHLNRIEIHGFEVVRHGDVDEPDQRMSLQAITEIVHMGDAHLMIQVIPLELVVLRFGFRPIHTRSEEIESLFLSMNDGFGTRIVPGVEKAESKIAVHLSQRDVCIGNGPAEGVSNVNGQGAGAQGDDA